MSVWNQCAKLLEANSDTSKNCTIHIFVKTWKLQTHALLLSAVNSMWFWDRVMLVWEIDIPSIVREGKKNMTTWNDFLLFCSNFCSCCMKECLWHLSLFSLFSFNLVFLTTASIHLKEHKMGQTYFDSKLHIHNKLKFFFS